eukprot:2507956-Pyramimonas_sp.AAC.1
MEFWVGDTVGKLWATSQLAQNNQTIPCIHTKHWAGGRIHQVVVGEEAALQAGGQQARVRRARLQRGEVVAAHVELDQGPQAGQVHQMSDLVAGHVQNAQRRQVLCRPTPPPREQHSALVSK